MGTGLFNGPLTPPHRRAAWAGAVDTNKEIEAMLPKDILKHAEKVKDVEAEVLKVLSKKPGAPTPAPSSWDPILQGVRAGGIIQGDALGQQQHAAFLQQAQRQEMDRQARQIEQLYTANLQHPPSWMRLGL